MNGQGACACNMNGSPQPTDKTPEVFFVVGEASGDAHAAQVATELGQLADVGLVGMGGQRMREAGVETLADSTTWSALGVAESLRKAWRVYKQAHRTVREVLRRQPELLVLVDCGAANVHIARDVKAQNAGQKILYYFPPRSWQREERDWSKLAAVVDGIATPFPWSAEILSKYLDNVRWVGHPVIDHLQPPEDRSLVRRQLGLPDGQPTVGLLAGSRPTERRCLGPQLLSAAAVIKRRLSGAHFLWSALPRNDRVERGLNRLIRARDEITAVPDCHDILRAADMALICLGTATLEAAVAGCLMATAYRGNWLMALEYCIRPSPAEFCAMPNIILQRAAVPELLHREANAERLAQEMISLWEGEERQARMADDLAEARAALGEPGAAHRAAQMILEML